VKIAGFIDESMDTVGVESEPKEWELRAKPAWQRLIVMLGGIFVNVILAWFLYTVILFCWGEKHIPMAKLVDGFSFNEGGELLGFKDGDQIKSIDGIDLTDYDPLFVMSSILFEGAKNVEVIRNNERVKFWLDESVINVVINNLQTYEGNLISPNFRWIVDYISPKSPLKNTLFKEGDRIVAIDSLETKFITMEAKKYLLTKAGKNIQLTYLDSRLNENIIKLTVPDDGLLGVGFAGGYYADRLYTLGESIPAGLKKTGGTIKMYWGQVKTIFNPKTGGYKHVGGLISIGKMFPGDWNWLSFWSMTALLSIILAIMNLLPIPALDGGHALIAIIEMVSGKKLPLSILMPLQIIGMVLLFTLLIYANGMDIVRLFN
tara:strand:- start:1224 stop:2348 length:1125 start_codon:yes stop_codon:yes gene_type:complete